MLKMVDLRSQILSARKPVAPDAACTPAAADSRPGSIAPESNSSFGIFDKKKKMLSSGSANQAHMWADDLLRSIAGRQERVVLAVRDAARIAEKQGLTPAHDEIYVTSSIRDGWNLKPDQLSKGLKDLGEKGFIRFTCSRRGRHARGARVRRGVAHPSIPSLDRRVVSCCIPFFPPAFPPAAPPAC